MARPFYEVISGRVTAAGTTFTGITMNTGDTLTIRNLGSPELLAVWSFTQGDGSIRLIGTGFHDTTQGLRLRHDMSRILPLFEGFAGKGQPLVKGDVLTVAVTGSATAGDVETHHLLIHYDTPLARLLNPSEVAGRIKRVVGIDIEFAAIASGDYSGEQAINADFSLLHADTEYAILGYMFDEDYGCIGFREATMTGGRRVAGPGPASRPDLTKDWFVRASSLWNRPMIPVFKQGDQGNLLVDATTNENSVTGEGTVLLAELSGKSD